MIDNEFNIKKKYCLITGAAGLLGAQHAQALLEINANLVLIDLNFKKLVSLKKNLKKIYPEHDIIIFKTDVSNENSIKKIKFKLKKKKIKLHILINNAAIDSKVLKNDKMINSEKFENVQLSSWYKHINVGLTGAMLCSKHFGSMIAANKSGGVIINIASDLSVIAPNHSIYKKGVYKPVMYSVIKHGIIGLTKYLSTYWSEKGVRCNAISPGSVDQGQSKVFIDKLKKLIPMKKLAKKEDYRGAIKFLCSDASKYMNGHNLIIDGGRSVW